ncbi:hypothetical protein CROQUDRAFT_519026 [Cronartium quercuum f. sp. fusiforme G11]|uniref:Uncharacterized protein n=1 Tax=Cronartium quercuum f. sp. fusiforme G11 TaxID=708437 RepID=A0A9P6NGI8_9BASI|nr:hypothetical protein CROQUDRAFT_519026 [Cronartium quercuum f. sp. fusiforme G11]
MTRSRHGATAKCMVRCSVSLSRLSTDGILLPLTPNTTPHKLKKKKRMSNQPKQNPSVPSASIRNYDHEKDFKFVRYLIGASILSRTGPANVNLFWSNPLVYIWVIAFTTYIPLKHMSFVKEESGRDYLKSVGVKMMMRMPVFVGPPLVLLVLLNWCHRIYFNSVMRQALHAEDMMDPKSYYKNTTTLMNGVGDSTVWVLEYDGRQLGVVAVEKVSNQPNGSKSPDHQPIQDTLIASEIQTMRIRHLATSIPFRPAGIDADLATHAVSSCFVRHPNVERIMISLIPIIDDVQIKAIEQIGFKRTISAHSHLNSSWTRLVSTLRNLIGWPDCKNCWREETWVLERSRFNVKLE